MSHINESNTTNDVMLLRKISGRDPDALASLYDLYSRYLYTIIFYILKDSSESEDLLQEVFIQIWEKIDSYDEALGNPLAWLTRITRNKAIDRLRSKSYKKRAEETDIERVFDISADSKDSDPEKVTSSSFEKTEIKSALKSLTESQRDLIEFAYFRGYSQTELAEHFKIPLGTVKTRMRTAMILLREKLKKLI